MAISSFIVAAFLAQMVSLDATDMELSDFLRFMAKAANMNVVIDPARFGKPVAPAAPVVAPAKVVR